MKKAVALVPLLIMILLLAACGRQQLDLADMTSINIDGKRAIAWEGRTYELFCVVSKSDCGEQIGYVDGDTDDRVSEYKGCSSRHGCRRYNAAHDGSDKTMWTGRRFCPCVLSCEWQDPACRNGC